MQLLPPQKPLKGDRENVLVELSLLALMHKWAVVIWQSGNRLGHWILMMSVLYAYLRESQCRICSDGLVGSLREVHDTRVRRPVLR